jgi:cation diffusion facilitator CzcD-associated flavoprotein CzcO
LTPADSHSYASAPEILGYFKDIVEKHKLEKYVKRNHEVVGAWWRDDIGKWKLKVRPNGNPEKEFYDEGEILINATGVLK